MFVFMSDVVTVNVCCGAAVVKNSVFSFGVLKNVVRLCRGCGVCFLFVL